MKNCKFLKPHHPRAWGKGCLERLGRALASALLVLAALARDMGAPRAQDGDSAQEVFQDHISGQIVQSRCINCHVEGGQSGHTRLLLVRESEANHEAHNLRAFENLLDAVEDDGGASYVLNKIQGVAHGGGPQVVAGDRRIYEHAALSQPIGQARCDGQPDAADAVRHGGDGLESQDAAAGRVDLCRPHPDRYGVCGG